RPCHGAQRLLAAGTASVLPAERRRTSDSGGRRGHRLRQAASRREGRVRPLEGNRPRVEARAGGRRGRGRKRVGGGSSDGGGLEGAAAAGALRPLRYPRLL